MVAGDLDIIKANIWGSDGNSIATPTGFDLILRQLHSSDGEVAVFGRIAPASPAAVSVVTDSNLNMAGRRLRITGAAATFLAALHAQASQQSNVDDPVCPSVATTLNDCLVLYGLADTWGDADPYTQPAGTSLVGTNQDQDSATLCIASKTQATAGATGTGTWKGTSGHDEFATWTLAIAPPGGGSGGVVIPVMDHHYRMRRAA
jgi:hypothetical protein